MTSFRIGHGYDAHRLTEGRALILGGVTIPWEKGLDGHSDADVLTHGIMDSLLGALALGDIGGLFPDTEAAYKGADSMELLKQVMKRIAALGWQLGNLDATLVAQQPKVKPYIEEMRQRVADACGAKLENISIKATTEEKMGFTGAGEGMCAHAVCLLYKD